jgi:ADP-heptose:LPS heptosyltransferase
VSGWLGARNILVACSGSAGEVLALDPALHVVKAVSPLARLTLLAGSEGAAVAAYLSAIDNVIVWQPVWQSGTDQHALIAELVRHAFDAALIFTACHQTPHIAGYLCYLAGIPLRAGQSKEFGGRVLTTEVKAPPDELSQVERNLHLVEELGFVTADRRPVMLPSLPLTSPDHRPWRIAVLRALHLGDLLLAVPALRSIRAGFPAAEITLIGLPWATVFVRRFQCYLDRFVEFVGYPGIVEIEIVPERTQRFIQAQRAYGYDLVIQMHGSGQVSNPLALALGARTTAGYYEGERPDGLTLGAPYPGNQPEVLRNLGIARLLGCPDRGPELEFPLFDEDHDEAATLLQRVAGRLRPWIGIHPGARPPARRWPVEYFATIADQVIRCLGAQVILIGGPGEEPTARAVMELMEERPVNVAGETSLGGLAALLANLDLFIGNDTGPAHVAEAAGTPSITIFGPADERRWAPLDQQRHRTLREPVECSPCPHWECPIDHRCLRRLEPGRVIEAAQELLLADSGAVA